MNENALKYHSHRLMVLLRNKTNNFTKEVKLCLSCLRFSVTPELIEETGKLIPEEWYLERDDTATIGTYWCKRFDTVPQNIDPVMRDVA